MNKANLNWNNLLTRLVAATGLFSLIGFADASYLTAHHFNGTTPACSAIQGCDVVTTSSYATIGPVPVALMGAIYYFTLLLLVMLFVQYRNPRLLRLASILPLIGLGPTLYFVYLQLFVINAICVYCMASAILTGGLAIIGIFTLQKLRGPVIGES